MRHVADPLPEELIEHLSESLSEELEHASVGDTHIIEAESFVLSFVLEGGTLEIRNIEVNDHGSGRLLLGAIHEYCDVYELSVCASNVKSTAVGFWIKMGYVEGAQVDEFFRVQ